LLLRAIAARVAPCERVRSMVEERLYTKKYLPCKFKFKVLNNISIGLMEFCHGLGNGSEKQCTE
jgi:hypothetical protein